MGFTHRTLLLHAEIRWLSRGWLLKRLCDLREEIIIFLLDKICDLVQYFKDIDWNMKLCYLADIFQLLNELNLSLQGTQKTMFHSYSNIEGQKKKIKLWITRVGNNCFEMFSTLMEFMSEANENNEDNNFTQFKQIIINHLNMCKLNSKNISLQIKTQEMVFCGFWIRSVLIPQQILYLRMKRICWQIFPQTSR